MPRKWESIICYENRAEAFTTSRWRLAGLRTRSAGENTDSGVLWLETDRDGDTVTASLYKDAGRAQADKVAEGSADVSGTDGSAGSAVEIAIAAVSPPTVTYCKSFESTQRFSP